MASHPPWVGLPSLSSGTVLQGAYERNTATEEENYREQVLEYGSKDYAYIYRGAIERGVYRNSYSIPWIRQFGRRCRLCVDVSLMNQGSMPEV